MLIEPYISQGPTVCVQEESCIKGCNHVPTMGQWYIHWQTDDGLEYGAACMTKLPIDDVMLEALEYGLWQKYEAWHESQG